MINSQHLLCLLAALATFTNAKQNNGFQVRRRIIYQSTSTVTTDIVITRTVTMVSMATLIANGVNDNSTFKDRIELIQETPSKKIDAVVPQPINVVQTTEKVVQSNGNIVQSN